MRYLKYSKIITFGLVSLTLSFVQCKKETGFKPYPIIKGQVTRLDPPTNRPIDSATVRLWINGIQSDTLTYFTDSEGNYSTGRINNWYNKTISIQASRHYSYPPDLDWYGTQYRIVYPDQLNAKNSINTDTLYIPFQLTTDNTKYLHTLLPERLDFPIEGRYSSYIFLINERGDSLIWDIGENNTEWMSIYWIRIVNAYDLNTLKKGGYVKFKVNISKLLTTGTYDSSILVITNRGNTIIPVRVVVE